MYSEYIRLIFEFCGEKRVRKGESRRRQRVIWNNKSSCLPSIECQMGNELKNTSCYTFINYINRGDVRMTVQLDKFTISWCNKILFSVRMRLKNEFIDGK